MKKMNHKASLLFTWILIMATGCTLQEPVVSRKNVLKEIDIERITGTWHEVAQWGRPERSQIAAVTLDVSMEDNGIIRLNIKKNKYTPYGPLTEIKGRAKWKADNPGIFKSTLFVNLSRKCYILYLDPDYSASLFCNNSATKLWIFSKDKYLTENQWAEILQRMESFGLDPAKLVWHHNQF